MHIHGICGRVLMLTMLFGGAIAQGRTLTLAESLKIAESKNSALAGDLHRQQAQREQLGIAKSGYLPTLNASVDYGLNHRSPWAGQEWNEQSAFSTRLSVPIFEGFRTKQEVAIAESGLSIAELEAQNSRLNMRRQVVIAFYQMEIAQRELDLGYRIVQRRKEQKELVQLRYKAGDEPRWAVVQAESDIADALLSVENIAEGLENLRDDLRQLLNISDGDPITVNGQHGFKPVMEPKKLEALVADLPEIKLAKMRIEQQRTQMQLERSDRWPKVSAYASWQRDLRDTDQGNTAFGIEANIKLFDPARKGQMRKNQEILSAAELDLADRLTKSATNLRRSLREYKMAIKKLNAIRLAMNAAKERAKIIGEEYAAGFRQYFEWEQAERQLIQYEQGIYTAEKSAILAWAELGYLSAGRLL